MPLSLPNLDDRTFEQLLEEAKRRIPVHTPEWTNFEVESDPGVTLVQLFAFLTESLLYRANRIPERNRLKFLQLLGVPLRPPAAADGLVAFTNERGPVRPLPLDPGVVVSAGGVDFLTTDPVNVLPVEAQVYYKRRIPETDPNYKSYEEKYEAVLIAQQVAEADAGPPAAGGAAGAAGTGGATVKRDFYESTRLPPPTPGNPAPVVNLAGASDRALYLALLAPRNVHPDDARTALANQTLSIGVAPVLAGEVPPLRPQGRPRPAAVPALIYEIADVPASTRTAAYRRLRLLRGPDVLTSVGVVQVELPGVEGLRTWTFPEPLDEGTDEYPPRLEDEEVIKRLVTWIRLRLPRPGQAGATEQGLAEDARLTWVGVNAAHVLQAVPVVNELLGQGTGEPDQVAVLANRPVIPASVRLVVVDEAGRGGFWRLTDDLLAAGRRDEVFTLDPESGQVRFGDGIRGARPPARARILVSYQHGGGPQGNVAVGAIRASPDPRLQGGYKVENPLPTSGGSLGESPAEGERNLPLVLRHRDRLVTAQDFRDLTRRTPGVDVGRVEVLPLFLPGEPPREDAPGVVTLMVVPRFDAVRPLWPTPDRLFLRRVCAHLEPRRLVTTEVYVRGPRYVPVYVSVGICVQGGHFPDVVRQVVSDRLNGYLSSLPPGGPEGRGWPLSKRLVRKDLEAVVTRVPGVEYVDSLEMGVGAPQDVAEQGLGGLELPMLVGLSVREGSAEPVASIFAAPADAGPPAVKVVPIPVLRTVC